MRVVADGAETSSRTLRQSDSGLRPRDVTVITIASGSKVEMTVTSADMDGVVGVVAGQAEPVRIAISDVERIERREFDGTKTLLAVAGYLVIGYVFASVLARDFANTLFSPK
jgi:hypothetical protein